MSDLIYRHDMIAACENNHLAKLYVNGQITLNEYLQREMSVVWGVEMFYIKSKV